MLSVEVMRAAARAGEEASQRAAGLLGDIALIPVDAHVIRAAESVEPLEIRSLDAVHIASAVSLQPELGILISYDRRMLRAAEAAGIPAAAPG